MLATQKAVDFSFFFYNIGYWSNILHLARDKRLSLVIELEFNIEEDQICDAFNVGNEVIDEKFFCIQVCY